MTRDISWLQQAHSLILARHKDLPDEVSPVELHGHQQCLGVGLEDHVQVQSSLQQTRVHRLLDILHTAVCEGEGWG